MSRYIDADKIVEMYEIAAQDEWNKKTSPISWADAYECIIADIDDAPTADVVEVRHGYWTFKNTTYCHYGCFCSVCGKKSGIGGIRENQLKPYCPNCGARMDGERKD